MSSKTQTVKIPQSFRFDDPAAAASLIRKWRRARWWLATNPFAALRYQANRHYFRRRKTPVLRVI